MWYVNVTHMCVFYTSYLFHSLPFKASHLILILEMQKSKAQRLRWWRICLWCRRPGLVPGSGRPPGEGLDNPPQYSCLESPMDRGAWRAPWGRTELDTTEQLALSRLREIKWITRDRWWSSVSNLGLSGCPCSCCYLESAFREGEFETEAAVFSLEGARLQVPRSLLPTRGAGPAEGTGGEQGWGDGGEGSLPLLLSPEEPWEASEGSRAEGVGVRADPLHVARPLLSRGACVVDAVLTPALSFQRPAGAVTLSGIIRRGRWWILGKLWSRKWETRARLGFLHMFPINQPDCAGVFYGFSENCREMERQVWAWTDLWSLL